MNETINEKIKQIKIKQDARKNIIFNIPLDKDITKDVFEFEINKDGIKEKNKYLLVFKIYRKDNIELTLRRDTYKDPVFTHEDYKNRLIEIIN
jgi:hypothetical protein